MTRRSLSTSAALLAGSALALSLMGAAPALAQDSNAAYPPGISNITLPAGASVVAKGQLEVRLTGFKPFSKVRVQLHSKVVDLGEFTTDATGSVTVKTTLPADFELGAHKVVASGVDPSGKPVTFTADFVVAAPAAAGKPAPVPSRVDAGEGIPQDGPNMAFVLGGLAIVVAAGGTAVAQARR